MAWIVFGSILGGIALIAILCILWGIITFNTFTRMKNQLDEAYSTMDVYLTKRYDLIPNLVETVKGYTKHENETLTNVMNARNAAMTATNPEEKIQGEKALTGTLKTLFAVAEAYPNLKADGQFTELTQALKNIESEIASSRKYYNGCVRQYNTKRETFPSSIIANMKKFEKRPLYEVDDEEKRQNVKVQF